MTEINTENRLSQQCRRAANIINAWYFTWIIVPNWTRYRRLPAVNLTKNITIRAD